MKKTIEQVKELLELNPELRDDDRKLVVDFWDLEVNFKPNLSFYEFGNFYLEGKITSESTIRRARRKVQELYPELRGKKWNERHAQQEPIKKELGYE